MKDKKEKLVALVKWVDAGNYTHNVPVQWIREFDLAEYNKLQQKNVPYAIEWRDKKRRPKGGWHLFDGVIVRISESEKELDDFLSIIDGVKSPRQLSFAQSRDVAPTDDEHEKKSSGESEDDFPCPAKKLKYSAAFEEESSENECSQKVDEIPKKDVENFKRKDDNQRKEDETTTQNIYASSSKIVTYQMYEDLKNDMKKQNEKIIEIKNAIEKLKNSESCKTCEVKLHSTHMENVENIAPKPSTSNSKVRKREIAEGTGVEVTEDQWKLAISKPTYTAMGVALMQALFPIEVLLKSNLRGGAPKKKSSDPQNKPEPQYLALDKSIVAAINAAVKERFSTTYNASGLGSALNNKMNALRGDPKFNNQENVQEKNESGKN